jgi:hypothetical protein
MGCGSPGWGQQKVDRDNGAALDWGAFVGAMPQRHVLGNPFYPFFSFRIFFLLLSFLFSNFEAKFQSR